MGTPNWDWEGRGRHSFPKVAVGQDKYMPQNKLEVEHITRIRSGLLFLRLGQLIRAGRAIHPTYRGIGILSTRTRGRIAEWSGSAGRVETLHNSGLGLCALENLLEEKSAHTAQAGTTGLVRIRTREIGSMATACDEASWPSAECPVLIFKTAVEAVVGESLPALISRFSAVLGGGESEGWTRLELARHTCQIYGKPEFVGTTAWNLKGLRLRCKWPLQQLLEGG